MKYAVIENNKVVNVIEAKAGFKLPGKKIVKSNKAAIGWDYVNEEFIEPIEEIKVKTAKQKRKEKYIEKGWYDTEALIFDILDRGIDAVKIDKDAIFIAHPEV